MRLAVWLVTVLFTVAVGSASAQRGYVRPDINRSRPTDDGPKTSSMKGRVAEVNAEHKVLVLEDKHGEHYTFAVTDDTHFRADKHSELAGKRDLELRDFKSGDSVRVTYHPENDTAVEVHLNKN